MSQEARKEKKKDRAKGGMIIGKRKGWETEEGLGDRREEGIVISKIKGIEKREGSIIILIYNSGNWERIEEVIREQMELNREECIIIGGDFNIRIGEEGEIEELKEMKRKSRDKIVSNGGRRFVN